MKSITHAGLQKTGAVDYPGLLSAVIFLPGCNLRCPYCHNPDLVKEIDKDNLMTIDDILLLIKKRVRIIKGVVITGGEPLIYPVNEIKELIEIIQNLGLKVKLDTNGTFPEKLSLLKPDFIAMDIKTTPRRYIELSDIIDEKNFDISKKIEESIKWIINSGINHEFRTTVDSDFFNDFDLDQILPLLKGASHWNLTPFKQGNNLDTNWKDKIPPDLASLEKYKNKIQRAGIPCTLRI